MTEKPKRDAGPESRPNQNTMFWALILIGLGIVFLLGNVINWGVLWPLLLIALGLFLLFGRSTAFFAPADRQTDHFSAPLDGATAAQVRLDLPVGESTVAALPASAPDLIDATLTHIGEIDFIVTGETEKVVRLSQRSAASLAWLNPANWFGAHDLRWDVGLNPNIPMRLDVRSGVGRARLDLRPLNLTELNIAGGVGDMDATLATVETPYRAHVSGGTGKVEVTIPPGAAVDLTIKGGVGDVRLNTPADAAVRVSVRSGIGDVHFSPRFAHVQRSSEGFELQKSGVWETPGFAGASNRIDVHFEGGVGSFHVR